MQHRVEGGRSEMKTNGFVACRVAFLTCSFIANILAVTADVILWPTPSTANTEWRIEPWPDIRATALTFQPEIPASLELESCSCIEVTLCPEFLEILELHPTHSEDLRRLTCGFKGFCPLVCCNQLSMHRHINTGYFPRSETYPPTNCNPVNTAQPRINTSPTPFHPPGVHYRTTTVNNLKSEPGHKTHAVQPSNNSKRLYEDSRLLPHDKSLLTAGNQNFNSEQNVMSNMPVAPDYFLQAPDVTYDSGESQSYPNNPTFYPQFGHSTYKPHYPHRSSEIGRHEHSAEEHSSGHQTGMHSNYNPTETKEGNFHYHKHLSEYIPKGYSNYPLHQHPHDPENNAATSDYGHDSGKDFFNPSFFHVQPSTGAHEDGFGYQSHPHNYHNDDQYFHGEDRPFLPQFQPGDTENTSTPSKMNDPGDGDKSSIATQWKRKLLPTDECGTSLGERIVGGKNAALGAYPWIARIGYTRSGSVSGSGILLYRCGGSLINNRYVITAAHCVTNLPGDLQLTSVRLGELDERTDPDCYQSECADPVQDFHPSVVIVHKDYDRPKFRNDLALIRLDRPVNITAYVSPICLPFDSLRNKSYTGLKSLVAGWGSTVLGAISSSPDLQWVPVTVVPSVACAKTFAERTGTQLGPGQICAGGEKGRDSCEGDSGGPLMRGEDEFQRYFLLGVVSFGARRCGSENLPGVYTEIPYYLDWILDTMEP